MEPTNSRLGGVFILKILMIFNLQDPGLPEGVENQILFAA